MHLSTPGLNGLDPLGDAMIVVRELLRRQAVALPRTILDCRCRAADLRRVGEQQARPQAPPLHQVAAEAPNRRGGSVTHAAGTTCARLGARIPPASDAPAAARRGRALVTAASCTGAHRSSHRPVALALPRCRCGIDTPDGGSHLAAPRGTWATFPAPRPRPAAQGCRPGTAVPGSQEHAACHPNRPGPTRPCTGSAYWT